MDHHLTHIRYHLQCIRATGLGTYCVVCEAGEDVPDRDRDCPGQCSDYVSSLVHRSIVRRSKTALTKNSTPKSLFAIQAVFLLQNFRLKSVGNFRYALMSMLHTATNEWCCESRMHSTSLKLSADLWLYPIVKSVSFEMTHMIKNSILILVSN